MEEEEKVALQNCFFTPEAKAALNGCIENLVGFLLNNRKSPAERGEAFSIPLLSIKQGDLFEAFEQTHFLEIPWELSKCDPTLAEAEYAEKQV